jgi:putative FmdB family regulatory protein|tara:strand:+ start:685 stop:933 length:249 start_codon:yes stop_codon:yes gene_type:complete
MPLQKYQCVTCKYKFEKLVRANNVKIECPECSAKQVKQLMPSSYSPFSEMEKRSALNKIAKTQGVGREVEKTWDPKKHQEHY